MTVQVTSLINFGCRPVDDSKVRRRDEGLKFYLAVTASAEKDQRRLQFLEDITGARIDAPVRGGKLSRDHAGLFKLRLTGHC